MNDREARANQSPSRVDGEALLAAFAALRARVSLGQGITIKELVETGRR